MENKTKYGKIEKGFFLRQYVDDRVLTHNGQSVKLEFTINIETCAPLVQYKDKFFTLSWQDIINMAIDAGLLEDCEPKPEGVIEGQTSIVEADHNRP